MKGAERTAIADLSKSDLILESKDSAVQVAWGARVTGRRNNAVR